MTAWLSRNTTPILIVLLASGVVVGLFEGVDALADPGPSAAAVEGGDADLEGAAALAGLIKVVLFLAVGAGATMLVRRRSRSTADQ